MKGNFLKKLFSSSNKNFKMDILAIFITGVILLIISSSFFGGDKKTVEVETEVKEKSENNNTNIETDIEKRLSEIFSQIEGAGNTKVMITLSSTSEKVIAKDTRQEKSTENGENSSSEKTVFEENTVSIENNEGKNQPFVISESMPQIQGAVIVSEGADNAYVKSAITEATEALLNLPSHKIAVFKMK